MPAQRKRKNADTDDHRTAKQARVATVHKSMKGVNPVVKPLASDGAKRQSKRHTRAEPVLPTKPAVAEVDKKRKRASRIADEDQDEDIIVVASRPAAQILSTPRNKRVKNAAPPSPTDTPTRGAASLFDRLNIDAKVSAIPCGLLQEQPVLSTPPHTPNHDDKDFFSTLPEELEELQDLNEAFLSTLAFYYLNNGSASPVDMPTLLPQISHKWGKRKVKLNDLRQILAIFDENERDFNIQDFGRAGICLIIAKDPVSCRGRPALNINPLAIGEKFQHALTKAWRTWQMSGRKEERTPAAFLSHLPLLEITKNESAARVGNLFARGQQRLADLKSSAKATSTNTPTLSPSPIPDLPQATQSRGTALLDRVLARQQLTANLPSGPTKEQLERKAALQRIEDVMKVLSLMLGTKERASSSVPAITMQIQQSLRNPISKDDIERCLGLMASEVVPGFVRVVETGGVKGVVISKNGKIGLEELRARIEKATSF